MHDIGKEGRNGTECYPGPLRLSPDSLKGVPQQRGRSGPSVGWKSLNLSAFVEAEKSEVEQLVYFFVRSPSVKPKSSGEGVTVCGEGR